MISVWINGKRIAFPDRSLIAEVKSLLLTYDVDQINRVYETAARHQTPRAKVYQQLIRAGLI